MIRHRTFDNGVKYGKKAVHKIVLRAKGLVAYQVKKRWYSKVRVTYKELYEDFSYREKEEILKRMNDAIISKPGRKNVIEFIWDEDVEAEMHKIILSNVRTWNEFDKE